MIDFVKPPLKPSLLQFGLTENDKDTVREYTQMHNKEKDRNETIIMSVSFVFAELTLFVLGILYFNSIGNKLNDVGSYTVLLTGLCGCLIGTFSILPILIIGGIYNLLFSLLVRTKKYPKEIIEKKERIIQYEKAVELYESDKKHFDHLYPGFSDCNYNVNSYLNLLFQEFRTKLLQVAEKNHISDKIDWWKSLSWERFEHAVANWFIERGYSAKVTKKSVDGGYDIIVHKNKEKAYVQCKHYKRQIGVSVVRELYGVKSKDGVRKGYIAFLDGGVTVEAEKFLRGVDISTLSVDILAMTASTSEVVVQDNDEYINVDNYWMKKELFGSVSEAINFIKEGKLDSFFSNVTFSIKNENVERDLFSCGEPCECVQDGYYGIICVLKYGVYAIIYSTLPALEQFGRITVVNKKTKEVIQTNSIAVNKKSKSHKYKKRYHYYKRY